MWEWPSPVLAKRYRPWPHLKFLTHLLVTKTSSIHSANHWTASEWLLQTMVGISTFLMPLISRVWPTWLYSFHNAIVLPTHTPGHSCQDRPHLLSCNAFSILHTVMYTYGEWHVTWADVNLTQVYWGSPNKPQFNMIQQEAIYYWIMFMTVCYMTK